MKKTRLKMKHLKLVYEELDQDYNHSLYEFLTNSLKQVDYILLLTEKLQNKSKKFKMTSFIIFNKKLNT
jgi:hypothetical protein